MPEPRKLGAAQQHSVVYRKIYVFKAFTTCCKIYISLLLLAALTPHSALYGGGVKGVREGKGVRISECKGVRSREGKGWGGKRGQD